MQKYEKSIINKIKNGCLDSQFSEILKEKLFLGNIDSAADINLLQKNKITHILVAGCMLPQFFIKKSFSP